MITIEDIELIDRFINDELDSSELQKFQERVRDSREFSGEVRKQVKAVRDIKTFAAVKFMESLEKDMTHWKSGGHKTYSPGIDVTKLLLWILVPALVLGLSYGIYKIVQDDGGQDPIKDFKESIEEVIPSESLPDTQSPDTQDVFRLKSDGDTQESELQINIEDPNTFSARKVSEENGQYLYELKYDGKTQMVNSDEPNLVEQVNAIVEKKKNEMPNNKSEDLNIQSEGE